MQSIWHYNDKKEVSSEKLSEIPIDTDVLYKEEL